MRAQARQLVENRTLAHAWTWDRRTIQENPVIESIVLFVCNLLCSASATTPLNADQERDDNFNTPTQTREWHS